jgi:caa(3)-type oxidase subunit IV
MSHGHHDHTRHYVKIWAILFGAFLVSVFGTFTPWFWVTMVVAFGVATYKAYLVIRHFMHLGAEKPFLWYALATALAFMVLFFAAASPDVMNHEGSRMAKFLNGPRWENVAAAQEKARREADHAANPDGQHGGPAAAGAEHGAAAPGHGAAGAEPGGAAPEHGEAPPPTEPAPAEPAPAGGHP